jgi:ketosteroid isomerase-like protein
MASAEDVARSYFDAIAARDVEAIASHYDPEVVVDFIGQGIFRGPDEMRAFFSGLFAALPDAEMKVERIVGGDGVAAVEWRLRGSFSGGELFGIEPTGRWIEQRGCDVLLVSEDGLVTRNTAYQDGMEMARSIGMMPPLDSGPERAMKQAFNLATKARRALDERLRG